MLSPFFLPWVALIAVSVFAVLIAAVKQGGNKKKVAADLSEVVDADSGDDAMIAEDGFGAADGGDPDLEGFN